MLFGYTIEYFDVDEDNELSFTKVIESGIIAADSYGKAVDRVIEFYVGRDTDDMGSIKIWECENPLCAAELSDFLIDC